LLSIEPTYINTENQRRLGGGEPESQAALKSQVTVGRMLSLGPAGTLRRTGTRLVCGGEALRRRVPRERRLGPGKPESQADLMNDRRPSLDIARTQSVTLGTYRSVGSWATAEARSESRRYTSRVKEGLLVLVGLARPSAGGPYGPYVG